MWRQRSAKAGRGASSAGAPAAAAATSALTRPTAAARPELVEQLKLHYLDVTESWMRHDQLPIVYHPHYNITLWGLEKLHPFDACKFEKVADGLRQRGVISGPQQLVAPRPLPPEALAEVHSPAYLQALFSSSLKVAQVTELAPLALLPHWLVRRKVLDPMRCHVGGTVLAAALAVERGWAVNLGGGMHHAHWGDGSGWCPFADITLAVRRIRAASGGAVRRVMLVDLDVHQGNGIARDKQHWGDSELFIVDAFNAKAFPLDGPAKAAIDVKVDLAPGTGDAAYLAALGEALQRAANAFPAPHLLVYNAGTDILAGDPLGRLAVSAEGVLARDAAVFGLARRLGCPIVMLLSGGYTRASAGVIVDSLTSLLSGIAAKQAAPSSQTSTAGRAGAS